MGKEIIRDVVADRLALSTSSERLCLRSQTKPAFLLAKSRNNEESMNGLPTGHSSEARVFFSFWESFYHFIEKRKNTVTSLLFWLVSFQTVKFQLLLTKFFHHDIQNEKINAVSLFVAFVHIFICLYNT